MRWTSEEDALLRAAYAGGRASDALATLPHRSWASLTKRAHRLKLATRPRWTTEEDERLSWMWGSGKSLEVIARTVGRTQAACYERARNLGMPVGCPQGCEYLATAALRTGYAVSQLRQIMRAAGLPMHRALSAPVNLSRKRSWSPRYVDPQDVDDAVAQWQQTEPVETAARRLGLCGATLRHRLRVMGVASPGRAHIRVTPAQIEQALALPIVAGKVAA